LFELFLSEYHVSPEQLNTEWTEEQVLLFLRKRNRKLRRMADAAAGKSTSRPRAQKISWDEFMAFKAQIVN
jgi:hypothetical protein